MSPCAVCDGQHVVLVGQSDIHLLFSGVPMGVVWGGSNPPRNSEDIGGVLDRMSKKNRRLDFLL